MPCGPSGCTYSEPRSDKGRHILAHRRYRNVRTSLRCTSDEGRIVDGPAFAAQAGALRTNGESTQIRSHERQPSARMNRRLSRRTNPVRESRASSMRNASPRQLPLVTTAVLRRTTVNRSRADRYPAPPFVDRVCFWRYRACGQPRSVGRWRAAMLRESPASRST